MPEPSHAGRQGRPSGRSVAAAVGLARNASVRAAQAHASATNIAAMSRNPRLGSLHADEVPAQSADGNGERSAGAAGPRRPRSANARYMMKARDEVRATRDSERVRKRDVGDARATKKARTTPAANAAGSTDDLDASDLFSPPTSPNPTDQRYRMSDDPPSPGVPPEHMPPHPADRIKMRNLREVDYAAGATINDLFEPQTACRDTEPHDGGTDHMHDGGAGGGQVTCNSTCSTAPPHEQATTMALMPPPPATTRPASTGTAPELQADESQ